jgi:hypothetical protein
MAAPKGNKNGEIWTKEKAKLLLENALDVAKRGDHYTFVSLANELNIYTHLFDYLAQRFIEFSNIKKEIDNQLKENLFSAGLNEEKNVTMAIFGLKAWHRMTDKEQDDENTTQNIRIEIIKPKKGKNKS